MRGTVVIFFKTPQAGRVKTRLGVEIGYGRAAALARIMLDRTLAEAADGPWRICLATDEWLARSGWKALPQLKFSHLSQGRGDLGERLNRVLHDAPQGPVIIIGADAPGLRSRFLRRAFQDLLCYEALFGPAADGGFWLAGFARRRPAPKLFENVRWSSQYALADTLKSLPANFSVLRANSLRDVDTVDDLMSFQMRSTS